MVHISKKENNVENKQNYIRIVGTALFIILFVFNTVTCSNNSVAGDYYYLEANEKGNDIIHEIKNCGKAQKSYIKRYDVRNNSCRYNFCIECIGDYLMSVIQKQENHIGDYFYLEANEKGDHIIHSGRHCGKTQKSIIKTDDVCNNSSIYNFCTECISDNLMSRILKKEK